MIDLKTLIPTKLLWVDLEMTGLHPQNDRILEVAAIVTDFNFNELGSYEAIIKQDDEELKKLLLANEWYAVQPEHMQVFIDQNHKGLPESEVEQGMINLLDEVFGEEPAVLAGNSIHNDRLFIQQWWPSFNKKLHYRMVDVTSFKLVMQAKYGVIHEKTDTHRALDDIRASIEELRFYLDYIKVEK